MKTVGELLRWRARECPGRLAIWCDGREQSYAELDRRSNQVANALIRAGVRSGDRVCVLDKSTELAFETLFGLAKAGGVFTPVNWRLAGPEVAFVVNDAEAPVFFVGPAFADLLAEIESELPKLRTIVRYGEGPAAWAEYTAWRDAEDESDPRRDAAEHETAWQLYTSGTTGHPKGTELTHHNLMATMTAGGQGFGGLAPDRVGLVAAPLYHIGGAGYALVLFFCGMNLVVCGDFEPGAILARIEEHRINHAFLVPAMINFLLRHPAAAKTDFSSLEAILYGASPIPEELLKEALEVFGCGFVQAYGLTETTGAITLLSAADHVPGSPRLRSCGLPIFGASIRVVDAAGNDCPPGNVGEILCAGDSVMKGYWHRPEANAESLSDGWFRSGDAGYFDEDGYLYIHDRVKDMIVSGGENIYPAEVENALYAHPAVADVAVIGVPDDKWGEAVKAVVVRKPGQDADAQALIDWCQGRIAGYKRPRSVDFVDELPRNPTGKILKRELRERYWEGQSRRVH